MAKDPNKNRMLSNRYRLVELIGTGAMGQVYRAEDTVLGGVSVAVKFLSQALLNKKMRERFEREATISALLGEKSIHVVRVRDYGVDKNEIPFYVMEFLQGESLSELIEYNPLPLPRFLNFSRQICLGVESAHTGIMFKGQLCPIIHRDIKPSNIFIIQEPTLGELAKILDFGIAKLLQTGGTLTQSFMGTLAYCSPEQMEGKDLDNRSDIYSLGVMMYEMLTNEMPLLPENTSFGGWYKAHHDLEPKPFEPYMTFPRELENLIMRCMSKSPEHRPQKVSEIIELIDKIEKGLGKKGALDDQTVIADSHDTTATYVPSVDEICLQSSWPKDKPKQKIVFPRLIPTPEGVFASLWVMLDNQDILKRMSSIRYNQFVFLKNPHPVILWITVLYNNQYGPRWLPCYLDLKTESGQQIARALGASGDYRVLFFAIEKPEECKNVVSSNLAPKQRNIITTWADDSKLLSGSIESLKISKKRLRQEFEKLKPRIISKLQVSHQEPASSPAGFHNDRTEISG